MCLISSSLPASSTDTFRCPNGTLIRVNDKLTTVVMKCDPPTLATKRELTGIRPGYPWSADGGYYGYYEKIELEEWVYNLGPTSFMMYLTFTNGVLTSIESGEYGY
ncbi:MAG TPA: DUF2845 domain-containing protein [Syntrophales bacterium]|nr:DUF2845 domain-containing protein [Syntrophales bacterium]